MRCDEAHGILNIYLDGELSEELSAKLDRHLLRCQVCAYEARTLEQTRHLLQSAVRTEEPTPAFRERTAARLLDALQPYLRPTHTEETGRQWILPLLREDP